MFSSKYNRVCPSASELRAFEKGLLDEATMTCLADHLGECTACEEQYLAISRASDPHKDLIESPNPLCAGIYLEPAYHHFLSQMKALRVPDQNQRTIQNLQNHVIGRYRIGKVLGTGGFGTVFLAEDPQLGRNVAIKVSKEIDQPSSELRERFILEARNFARLRHPLLVSIYDIGWLPDQRCYLVLEYVPGIDLSRLLSQESFTFERSMRLSLAISEAIAALHGHGLLHRDLKPGNILVTTDDSVRITDFGLSVYDEFTRVVTDEFAGTLTYMAPEQIRGEAHRLDVRTDIWSLGVIMYRMFTGTKPFSGSSRVAIEVAIQYHEPQKPSSINPNIPVSIERVLLKCLAKRMSHRFSSITEVVDDLKAAITSRLPEELSTIVPRGLRSFSEPDHAAYLQLLPGLRSRDGLPELISKWKNRIESRNAFSVGAVVGPSGVGKSSFLKAGLIPALSVNTTTIYLRVTPDFSDAEIAKAIQREFPEMPLQETCADCIRVLRQRTPMVPTGKTLIILDQFEQCLSSERHWRSLATALGQCDGVHIVTCLCVRDDYFLALTRFMNAMNVELIPESNLETLHPFDPIHARHVLLLFGASCGKCPSSYEECNRRQRQFIDRALSELAVNDRLTPLHLALFCEVLGEAEWHINSLASINLKNIGVSYLETSFAITREVDRSRRETCIAILGALLPLDTELADQNCTEADLAAAAGCIASSDKFTDSLRFLEEELRLVVSDTKSSDDPPGTNGRYRLVHDFIVQSLKEWITSSQMATAAGRAKNCLVIRTAAWKRSRDVRQLPSLVEWLWIKHKVNACHWTLEEKAMITVADWHHTYRLFLGISVLSIIILATAWGRSMLINQRIETHRAALLNRIKDATSDAAIRLIETELSKDGQNSEELHRQLAGITLLPKEEINLRLALATYDSHQYAQIFELVTRHAATSEFPALCRFLNGHFDGDKSDLLRIVEDHNTSGQQQLKASWLLLAIERSANQDDSIWKAKANDLTTELLSAASTDPSSLPALISLSFPARDFLLEPLQRRFMEQADEDVGFWATEFLFAYTQDLPDQQASLILQATPKQFRRLINGVQDAENLIEHSRRAIDPKNSQQVVEQANAILAMLRFGHGEEIWQHLRLTSDPTVRSLVIDRIALAFARAEPLVERLMKEQDVSVRRAIVLSLGRLAAEGAPPEGFGKTIQLLEDLQMIDDPGLNAACCWALAQMGETTTSRLPSSRTMLESSGHHFSVIQGPVEFEMGSSINESRRYANEGLHKEHIGRSFAISVTEVTESQYDRCLQSEVGQSAATGFLSGLDDMPKVSVTWNQAAAYCNWLSFNAGMSEGDLCYTESSPGQFSESPSAHEREGFRLPTESEWEFACRAGTSTSRYFGEADKLLPRYAHLDREFEKRNPCAMLLPNDLGLFDMLGNVREWCHDRYQPNSESGEVPLRIVRGGSYFFTTARVRSASRDHLPQNITLYDVGFRIAKTVSASSK